MSPDLWQITRQFDSTNAQGLSPAAVLNSLRIGVSVIDRNHNIVWVNREMEARGWVLENVVGTCFYRTFMGEKELPTSSPTSRALASGEPAEVVERGADGRWYEVISNPIKGPDGKVEYVVELCRDVTGPRSLEARLESLYHTVDSLLALDAQVVARMTHAERVELLKRRILELSQHLLPYDNFILDLVNTETKVLDPVLFHGYDDTVRMKKRRVGETGSGITGWAAATGKPYLCKETMTDPLYMRGIANARSSMTVPLRIGDTILGTFNVESRQPNAFTEDDLKYLEILGHFLAIALNTMNLLQVEEVVSVRRVAERLADRINNVLAEILTSVYLLKQQYIMDEDYVGRLNVVDRAVAKIGEETGNVIRLDRERETTVFPAFITMVEPKFKGKRLLVAEDQDHIREALVAIGKMWGFEVDCAPDGQVAIELLRQNRYDLVLSDVNMPRMGGGEVFLEAKKLDPKTGVIFITGGYDPSHATTKYTADALLYKPFKVSMLKAAIAKIFQ